MPLFVSAPPLRVGTEFSLHRVFDTCSYDKITAVRGKVTSVTRNSDFPTFTTVGFKKC